MTRVLLCVLTLVGPAIALAQRPSPAALTALLDSLVPAAIATTHVPGAVVAVVRGDSVIALRGYGFAHLEDSVRADPVRSVYRLASVAKLFVATTVLERARLGRLDLERDVTSYTPDVHVPPTFPGPITLRQLLTHTAGFDERVIGYAAPSREQMRPLGEYLAARLPDRGWPAGALVSYSNHGMSLAAYAAEREAGVPFRLLARQTVFDPLGMRRTFYVEPPDEDVGRDLAPGYRCGPSGCERAPVVWSHAYPVGLAFSTGDDMSRFMRAWLNDGVLDGRPALDTGTVHVALRQQFTHHPSLPGIAYGFFEQQYRGHRLLTHAGGVPGTSSALVLAPKERIGVFLVTNAGEPRFTRTVVNAILDTLLPDDTPAPPIATGPVGEYAGGWRLARYSHHTVERFPAVFAFTIPATAEGDTLVVGVGSGTRRFVRVDSLQLQEVADGTRLVLRRDPAGRLTHLFTSLPAGGAELPGAFERVPWFERPYFLNEYVSWLIGFPVIVLAVWGIAALGTWWWRRRRSAIAAPAPRAGGLATAAVVLSLLMVVGFLWFAFGFVAASTRDLTRGVGIAVGFTVADLALLRLAWVLCGMAVPIVALTVMAWRRGWWSAFGRACYSVLALFAVGAAHFLLWFGYVPGRW